MSKINLLNPLFQSPYTYLQAAGSDGSDGSAKGIHLRWDFLRQLGDEHLPKGNLSGSTGSYPSTSGFNKNNDFVRIYRVPYNKEYTVTVDFSLAPNALTETGNVRHWHYNGFTPVAFDTTNTTDVIISFTDIDEYDTIRTTIDPSTNSLDFIKEYKGVIEAKTVNKLMFKGMFDIAVKEPTLEQFATFRAEAVSLIHDNFDLPNNEDKYFISCRKLLKRLDPKGKRTFVCENISHFRFSFDNFYIKKLILSTYQDHIIGENGPEGAVGNFTLVDQFSLDDGESDSNSLVFKRLEDIPKYVIDQKWPKYNDLNTSNGEFTVKVQNYKDRWLDPLGLKEAVKTYLDLSPTDAQATGYLQSEDPENEAYSEISYLDMIKLVSLDFHAARMLGLGHIDKSKGGVPGPRDGGLQKEVLIEFINNSSNSSAQVRDYLVDKAPNSEPVLIAAVNRTVPLTANHLRDVLNATPNLDDSVLIAAINRSPALTPGAIQDVLVANSPLSNVVLLAMINRQVPLPPGTLLSVLEENNPLSDEVLLAIVNRTVPLPPGTIQSIMIPNSPLSDEVLLALLLRQVPLPPGTVRNIFLENTPLSPIVEDALVNRQPPLPNNIINAILNSSNIASQFRRTHCIYVMEYVTEVAIENYVPTQTTTHVFMSLPTSPKDYRLPATPVFKPVTYGLFVNNATGSPTQLTDDDGYTPYADERFINLKRDRFQNELPYEDFFFSRKEFCICDESPAIGFGIEYKLDSESTFRKPEINHDTEFSDHAGIPETIFVPNNGNELVYNHEETQEGIHDYALYSVNWFSRVSPISNIQQTDFTKFKKRNTILPPFNFAVQLIQEESPIMFTTQLEQDTLAAIAGTDKTLVRATFDWNYNHHRAYQIADYAELFFRKDLPKATRGKVLSKTQLPNRRVQIITEPYTITSTSPIQIVQPNINPADVSRFVGSNFASGEKTFIVESVSSTGSGDNPIFVLEQIRETSSTDMNNDNIFTVTENFVDPEIGDVFLVVENLSEASNWDAQLTKKVYLESFFTVVQLQLQFSDNPENDRKYTIESVALQGSDTEITVFEDIADDSVAIPGEIVFSKKVKVIDNTDTSSVYTFTVEGDITTELNPGEVVLITASNTIDNSYNVVNVTLSGSDTLVEVTDAFIPVPHAFYLTFNKTATISALNSTNKTITISGDITGELIPPYREFVEKPDGTLEKVIVGGIFEDATITEFEDKDQSGNAIPGSRTGVYEIVFNSYQLEDHLNDSIDWHKGIVRILEDATFLPTALEPDRTTPVMKILQVWSIDTSGATLKLTVFDASIQVDTNYDPINEYVPIDTGASVDVNFHPSYRTYMLEDSSGTNNFNKNAILPIIGEGSRQTFMGIRAIDIKEVPSITSHITNPVILLAQEILVPLPPGIPTGPTFATRPDFYGKATYTFDVEINTTDGRKPHMLVFYRANERKILDQLYTPDRVADILNELENLEVLDADFFPNRWSDLVNVELDSNGLFKEHTPGGFRFPIPNNGQYSIPQADINAPAIFPFDGNIPPGDMVDIVKQAIDGAFLSLTEQPAIYQYINEGKQTSGVKPKIRDNDGQMLLPDDPEFNPVPMAVKFEESGVTYVRFTDYTLDGAAKNFYFYYGIELTNQLKVSGRSPIAGPIKLVNASAAEEPAIKKVTTQLSNELINRPTAVLFEVNDYITSEGIKKIDIYRTTNPSDSLSVRTMELAKSVEVGNDILDDFSDVAFPLYGDPLFYRIVAQREIQNEDNSAELIPSKPSNVVLTNIVDNVNPQPPELTFTSDPPTASPVTLNNVVLSWEPTCYNGTYYLQVMTTSGNWHRIFEIKSNDPLITVDLVDTDLQDGSIIKQDDEGNTIYKRFRVQAENSSGLLNLVENELTI